MIPHNPMKNWYWGDSTWRPGTLALGSDEAYEIQIKPKTVQRYIEIHGGTPQSAIEGIRALLEDLITANARTETDEEGRWRIFLKKQGYGLMLSPDRCVVITYCTKHRERTWAEFRASRQGPRTTASTSEAGTDG